MRVIAGKAKGHRLATTPGRSTRPTTDRVKESLFNILAQKIESADFLDIFAGSGAIGIEALSRGARRVVFVDSSRACGRIIAQNLEKTKLSGEIIVETCARALRSLGRRGESFDLIFADPPYGQGFTKVTLELVAQNKLLRSAGLLIMEQPKREETPDQVLNLLKIRRECYGGTCLGFYINEGDNREN